AHLQEVINDIQLMIESGNWEGINLANNILTPEQLAELKRMADEAILKMKEIDAAKKGKDDAANSDFASGFDNTIDILGMTAQGWASMFSNLDTTRDKMLAMANVAYSVGSVWQTYNAYITAGEQQRLSQFRRSQNEQREALESRLRSGLISQENYNQAIGQMDDEVDQMSAQFAYNQAKRDKELAYFQAIVNTAAGITVSLT